MEMWPEGGGLPQYLSMRRGVAQSGSAPQWGCGGRRFKSSHPDQTHTNPRARLG